MPTPGFHNTIIWLRIVLLFRKMKNLTIVLSDGIDIKIYRYWCIDKK